MNKQIVVKKMLHEIQQASGKEYNLMEVCGTHTQAISRFGIRQLVEPKLNLLSGPGCPVCVTSEAYMDSVMEFLKIPNIIVATFGDMMKVRGSSENLLEQKSKGKNIRIVYSPLEAVKLAEENQHKEIVFLAVGFETTSPLIALAVKFSREKGLNNISFLTGMKRMEPILHHILSERSHNIDGLICPGHVAAVMGEKYFEFISEQYNVPAVIAGFEAEDIVGALYFLLKQQESKRKEFKNLYRSCVTNNGNQRAKELMEEVFVHSHGEWRGIGKVKESGLALGEEYKSYDAIHKFNITPVKNKTIECACSEIILGKKLPYKCELFGKACTPEHPAGPCMISSEGACSIFYRYK